MEVPTRCVTGATDRYPLPESVLGEPTLQSYIHDCLVAVHEGDNVYRFRIFFKCHCRLRINKSMGYISRGHIFRGDALIMRVGARDRHSVVNMRDRDTVLSDYAIIKYVLSA